MEKILYLKDKNIRILKFKFYIKSGYFYTRLAFAYWKFCIRFRLFFNPFTKPVKDFIISGKKYLDLIWRVFLSIMV